MKKVVLLAVLVGVSGCESMEQAQKRREQEALQEIASFHQQCEAYGFQKGTNEHASCVKDLANNGEESEAQRSNLMMQKGLELMGSSNETNYSSNNRMTCRPFGTWMECN